MARGSDRIVALDIGASSIKAGVFVAHRRAGIELLGFSMRELGNDPGAEDDSARMEQITAATRELMEELGIPAGGPVLLSVPGQAVFSRFVKLPPVSREKILQIVRYEAQQNVPFPIDEVVWDYQLVGDGTGEVDVMLAAIKREMIEDITGAVSAAGLQPELVDVAPMTLYNAVRYNYPELPACTLVIDIGARSTDLIFIEASRVFNRSIPVGGNAITQQIMREFDLPFETAEQLKREHAFVSFGGAYEAPASETADKVSKTVRAVMTRLHAEITRSINFYRTQQSGSQPGLILLTGGSAIIAHIDTFLKEKLRIPVDHLNPFNNIAVNAAIDAKDIGGQAHLLSEVAGLALRQALACPIELNLIPPAYLKTKAFQRRQPFLVAALAVMALMALVWWAFFTQRAAHAARRLAILDGKVGHVEQVEGRLMVVEGEVRALEDQGRRLSQLPLRRALWPRLVSDLYGRVPEGMWLTRLAAHRGGPPAPDGAGAAEPDGLMPPPMEPAPGAGVAVVEALELTGYAYLDKVPMAGAGHEDGILQFRNALRASPFLSEKTDVTQLPTPARDDFVREFTIRAVLKQPVQL
jgi:type IV pilus assembly protein PilM